MYTDTKIIVRYAETDKMGIVHHSVYPIWYEAARTDFISKAGMKYSEMEKQGLMLPLVELNCRFSLPADYEDELIVRTKIGKLSPVRIMFEYEVFKEGTLINTGSTMHALTNKELKPVNMKKAKPEIYDFLEKLME